MKNTLFSIVLTLLVLCSAPFTALADANGNMQGLKYDAALRKLFGDNQNFTADIEVISSDSKGSMSITSHMVASEGKCRFEFGVADIKGSQMPAEAVGQMKAMGMDRTIIISKDDGKSVIMIYPGLSSYVVINVAQVVGADSVSGNFDDLKADITKIGSEKIEGHKCTKNKMVISDKAGVKHESTVWNARDLKNYPIMIKTVEGDITITMHFRDVSFATPDAKLFEPPAEFTKYSSMQAMMQQELMKRMSQQMNTDKEP